MLFDIQNVEIGPKMAEIAQIAWKLHVNWMKVCEGVCESVWKYHHWISQLEYMLFYTQYVEIRPKMAEMAKLREYCVKVREGVLESVWNFFFIQ